MVIYSERRMPGLFWVALIGVGVIFLGLLAASLSDAIQGSFNPYGALFWGAIGYVLIRGHGWNLGYRIQLVEGALEWRAPLRRVLIPLADLESASVRRRWLAFPGRRAVLTTSSGGAYAVSIGDRAQVRQLVALFEAAQRRAPQCTLVVDSGTSPGNSAPVGLLVIMLGGALLAALGVIATAQSAPPEAAPPTSRSPFPTRELSATSQGPVSSAPPSTEPPATTTTIPCPPPAAPPDPPTGPPAANPRPARVSPSDQSRRPAVAPATRITLVGCGRFVLDPGRYDVDASNVPISLTYRAGNGFAVTIDGTEALEIEFMPPDGQDLTRGVYANVKGIGDHNPVKGGFSLRGRGQGCSDRSTFTIYEFTAVYDIVTRLLATFEQRCESLDGPPNYGVIDLVA